WLRKILRDDSWPGPLRAHRRADPEIAPALNPTNHNNASQIAGMIREASRGSLVIPDARSPAPGRSPRRNGSPPLPLAAEIGQSNHHDQKGAGPQPWAPV